MQVLATIRTARQNLDARLFLLAVYSLGCIEPWSLTAVPKNRRRSQLISLDIFTLLFDSELMLRRPPREGAAHGHDVS
jgi:hypothetical protein